MNSRYRAHYYDPAGIRYAIATFPWRLASERLAARRQLAALGLRAASLALPALVSGGAR